MRFCAPQYDAAPYAPLRHECGRAITLVAGLLHSREPGKQISIDNRDHGFDVFGNQTGTDTTSDGTLARTGADLVGFALAGALTLVLGALALRTARHRTAAR